MIDRDAVQTRFDDIRRQAEQLVSILPGSDEEKPFTEEMGWLIHELRVHQVQLEMQNEELRKSLIELDGLRQQYFNLYDLAPVSYITINENGLILKANISAARLLGVDRRDLVMQPIAQFISPDDLLTFRRKCRKIIKTGGNQSWKQVMTTKDDVQLFSRIDATSSVEDGVSTLRMVIIDITEQKKPEDAFLKTNKLMDAVLTHIQMLTAYLDIDFNFIWVNPAYAATWKKEPPFFTEKNFFSFYPHEDNKMMFHSALTTGEPYFASAKPFEFPGQPERGVTYWDWSLIPVSDSFGIITGFVFTQIDVTTRIRAERALLTEQDSSRLCFDIVGTALVGLGLDGTITLINRRGCEMVGLTQEELIGQKWVDMMVPEAHRDKYEAEFEQIYRGLIQSQSQVLTRNGEERSIAWRNAVLRNPSGKIVGLLRSGEDITDSRLIEETLLFLLPCGYPGSNENFFQSLTRYLANILKMDFISIDRLTVDLLSAKNMSVFFNGEFRDNVTYMLKDTPCGDMLGKTVCVIKNNVRQMFSKNTLLQEIGAESYIGSTLWSSQGEPIGLITLIGRKPLESTILAESILKLVGVRVAGELERIHAENELKNSLHEKEMLLRELYHRTKNNMQVIISFLNLQSERITDSTVLAMIRDAIGRIKTMALVHQKLYQAKNLTRIDLKDYIMDLTQMIAKSHIKKMGLIEFRMDLESVNLTIDTATPCGLILNELITNSMKHAFPGESKGEIRVTLHKTEDGDIEIGVKDNGVGFGENMDIRSCQSLGLESVLNLTEHQLKGRVDFRNDNGARFLIRFKEPEYFERIKG